jgi:hypothetical protein
MMPEMRLEIAAALTFIVWLPLPLRAADPVAVPGTADVVAARAWDLLMPPQHFWDTTAPLSQWKILRDIPDRPGMPQAHQERIPHHTAGLAAAVPPDEYAGCERPSLCDRKRGGFLVVQEKYLRCVASDDPRLKVAQ